MRRRRWTTGPIVGALLTLGLGAALSTAMIVPDVAQAQIPPADDVVPDATGVIVAIIDAPDREAPALRGRVLDGVSIPDLARGEAVAGWQRPNAHGTAVAGLILEHAPGARILPIDIDDPAVAGDGSTADLARGITWAVDNGAQVINVSAAVSFDDPAVRAAVDDAWARGVLVVAGAGNSGSNDPDCDPLPPGVEPNEVQFPAGYESVFAVGGAGTDGHGWECSQTGPHVDAVAPAEDVELITADGGRRTGSGTSYAAPLWTALAARALQMDPLLSAELLTLALLAGGPDDLAAVLDQVQRSRPTTFDNIDVPELDPEDEHLRGECLEGLTSEMSTLRLRDPWGILTLHMDMTGLQGDFEHRPPPWNNLGSAETIVLTYRQLVPTDTLPAPANRDFTLWLGTSIDPADYEIHVDSESGTVDVDGPLILDAGRTAEPNLGSIGHTWASCGWHTRSTNLVREPFTEHNLTSSRQAVDMNPCQLVPGTYAVVAVPEAAPSTDEFDLLDEVVWWQSGTFPTIDVTTAHLERICPWLATTTSTAGQATNATGTIPAAAPQSRPASSGSDVPWGPLVVVAAGLGVAAAWIRSRRPG